MQAKCRSLRIRASDELLAYSQHCNSRTTNQNRRTTLADHHSPKTSHPNRRVLLKAAAALGALPLGRANATTGPSGPGVGSIPGAAPGVSWAITSDVNTYAAAYAARFTNVFFNPLSSGVMSGTATPSYKPDGGVGSTYSITVEQTQMNVLGVAGKLTTVWGYKNYETTAPTFPGRTFQVNRDAAITVKFVNALANASGPLPHIMPMDPTIAMTGSVTGVPISIHHHGGDNRAEFDGTPDQWTTPNRAQVGPTISALNMPATGAALQFQYANTQEASLHWYHDHAESVTRLNVHVGMAGLYVIRDANETTLQTQNVIPKAPYELAMMLQDRTFDASGNFNYSANPADYPLASVRAIWPTGMATHMPEMFGDVILVNGLAWPNMRVEPRPYRVRLLNGSDSRFYTLAFGAAPVCQIGSDLGFINQGTSRAAGVTIAPGERIDLVVDFSNSNGALITVTNSAATPYPLGVAPTGGAAVVMRFQVNLALNTAVPKSTAATLLNNVSLRGSTLAPTLVNPQNQINSWTATNGYALKTRRILLAEGTDQYGRITPLLGVFDPNNAAANLGTRQFKDPATENPTVGTAEIWEFWNVSVDSHPIHMHLAQFQVVSRSTFTTVPALQATTMTNAWTGVKLLSQPGLAAAVPAPREESLAWKDTVIAPPNSVTRVLARFNKAGKYVYHCHILSHEEHDMMRWYNVV
jgi:spore coat protein A, manganese oxidase